MDQVAVTANTVMSEIVLMSSPGRETMHTAVITWQKQRVEEVG